MSIKKMAETDLFKWEVTTQQVKVTGVERTMRHAKTAAFDAMRALTSTCFEVVE